MQTSHLATIAPAGGLDRHVDRFFETARGFGAGALIYDYTPDTRETDGSLMAPSLMKVRNIDPGMVDYWCARGYVRVDPVQAVAVESVAPFLWSYDSDAGDLSAGYLTNAARPVVDFILAHGFQNGITVPIHLPGGGYVTITGLWPGRGEAFRAVAAQILPGFALLSHGFQNEARAAIEAARPRILSPREAECLTLAAEGLSAKEISRRIDRSAPTVVMHLNAAIRKLGARNRAHAVAEAIRRRMI